jgi:hypothetical protein
MAREIPEIVRAAAGLAATVLDEAQKLPDTLPGLPVRALGIAMQVSMKLQQHYAGLVARGDELFTGLHGEDEPGLATFDDDEPGGAAATVKNSAFDRVAETIVDVTDDEARAETEARATTDEVLDELAIEELVDEAPAKKAAARKAPAKKAAAKKAPAQKAPAKKAPARKAAARQAAEDGAGAVDVLAPRGGVATVEATVTDEGVAAVEGDGGAPAPTTAEPLVENSLSAPATAPVDGYDDWSIAQLRGRLRGYATSTVEELLGYEEATRARQPYLRMLRNRLEKLVEQAVETSPLAPRGA